MAYVTARELEESLGGTTYLGIFADSGHDVVNEHAVSLVLRAAHADVLRFIPTDYDIEEVPEEVWALELDFARARAYMRGDSYTRDTGEKLYKDTLATAKAMNAGDISEQLGVSRIRAAVSGRPCPTGAAAAGVVAFDNEGECCSSESIFWRNCRKEK